MLRPTVRRTVRELELLEPGGRVLVGASGGPDSTALLHVLQRLADELGITVVAASVDHGLRAEAGAEMALVERLCVQLDVPCHRLSVKIEPGPSLQARARSARYDALKRCAAQVGATRVAVGHTLDDQAETVLSRLLRGASVGGLAGIDPHRADGVIRPLLRCRRADVRAYVAEQGLPVAADPSNDDRRFERVRLRHELLPRLEAEDARIAEHLAALADDAREVRALLTALGEALLAEARSGPERLQRARLAAAPRPVRREALARWLRGLGVATPSRSHLQALDRAVRDARGEVRLGDELHVRSSRGSLEAVRTGPRPARGRALPHGSGGRDGASGR